MEQFSAEVSGMLEEFNTTVEVIYVDSKVQGQKTFIQADLPLTLKLKGDRGTDFRQDEQIRETPHHRSDEGLSFIRTLIYLSLC
ncbi:uncharacterized protein TOL2_C14200 [Desulfobacula toluolica Tol2]|uniref:VWA-like domain-containing protein n=1 Tax=Desulfobacula toluolica (strain DSM 7467 / Tol2) TaxID=651182 RepID=K0NII6_DESTT|nr:uncharacterized protein TOL2_C14200 [Desulfobacula toluolica Tol2]